MEPKPQTHNGDLGKLPPALAHLRNERVWVCWKWFHNGKKWTKPPYQADDPECYASTSNPDTWGTYETAIAQVIARRADGIGFVLKGARDIGAADLDHCRDPQTMAIEPWADDLIRRFPSDAYLEATVSGTGLRIIGTSEISLASKHKLNHGNGAAIEFFSNSTHYLTLSCNEIGRCNKLPPIGDAITSIDAELSNRQEEIDFDAQPRGAARPDQSGEYAPDEPARAGVPSSETWSFAEEARLRAALAAIPTDEKLLAEKFGHVHDTWVRIGRAIERLDWGDRGYAIFRDWSAQNATEFDEKGLLKQWRSFNRNRNARGRPVTIATVYRYAMKCGWSGDQPAEQHNDHSVDVDVGDEITTTIAANLEMRGIDWLWPGRFARGKFGLIAGMPDMGKGQIAAFIAAAITARIDLPCGEGNMPRGSVIWFNAEDGAADTVKPRLVAAGADVSRVHFVNSTRVGGEDRMFSLITDLQLLRKKINQIGDVQAVIIDPTSAYLGVGKVDSRSATDVRSILTPLKELAEELHVAVIGICHFNKKDDVKSAMLRVSDSIAYVAAARHVYAVLDNPEDKDTKLFIKAKNNLAPDTKALRYGIGVQVVGRDQKLGVDIDAPFIVWHSQYVEMTANEAMAAAGGSTAKRAREFLQERLRSGPVKADDLVEEAKQEGISFATLRRAKKELGIKSRKGGFDGEWIWELPPRI